MSTENGTVALPAVVENGLARFRQAPVIDRIEPRTLELLQKTIAQDCSGAEVGHFLELCAHYQLDPFAREAWVAKSRKTNKLLIMVGRDGLRKIAQRNGLHLDGDVVRENDEFSVVRSPDGNRTIAHSYSKPTERGKVIGAWAECRDGGPGGRPMGYFYAPLEEYRPANADSYSPWSKQVGVMILGAAERQAIRQATPLSGLLADGEEELVDSAVLLAGDGHPKPDLTVEAEVVPEDHLLGEDESKKLLEIIAQAKTDDNELQMLLTSVGVDCTDDLTVKSYEELLSQIEQRKEKQS